MKRCPVSVCFESCSIRASCLRLASDNDERRHLFGTTRILNSIASFAADGGLREAASWVSLRQHIYISLTSQHPLTINLTNYGHSNAFHTSEDESWANRIIFIFA